MFKLVKESNNIFYHNFHKIRKFCDAKPVLKHKVVPEIEEEIKQGVQIKRLSSFSKKGSVHVPAFLETTAMKIVDSYKTSTLVEDVKNMENKIFHSQLPPEKEEIELYAKDREERYTAKEKSNIEDFENLSEEEKLKISEKIKKKIEFALRKKIKSWSEYEYNEYKSILYLASRFVPNYLATNYVFNEIKRIDPGFKPSTLFDFGSGLGTTMFVANQVWPSSIFEHLNIEKNSHMIDLCDLLLKNGNNNNPSIYNNVFYKKFLPVGRQTKYNLVVCAYTLKELPSVDSRIHVIENLWNKTDDVIVFIEKGNQAGTSAVLEARSFILKLNGYDPIAVYDKNSPETSTEINNNLVNPNVHIMAPCSHHYCCPRLFNTSRMVCKFFVNYSPLFYGQQKKVLKKEEFSYVVLRKKPKIMMKTPAWPRVVEKPIKKSKNVILKLCTAEGKIENVSIAKKIHTHNTYQCAKACKWGDIFPVSLEKHIYKKKF